VLLNKLRDSGYKVISQKNKGQSGARNAGVSLAKGKYILPVDADNKIKPEYVSEGIKILDKYPEIGVVYSDAKFFGSVNRIIKVSEFDLNIHLVKNNLDNCAMYRKSIWEQVEGYDEKMPYMGNEDWELWTCIAEKGWKFHKINKPLYYYRVREDSMLTQAKQNIPDYTNIILDYMHKKHSSLFIEHYKILADYYQITKKFSIVFHLYSIYLKYIKKYFYKNGKLTNTGNSIKKIVLKIDCLK
jgi:glycosyltransferase involved in cell wall biosynthesis